MTTKMNGIYKCDICGNIVEILNTGAGELVCCGENMKHMTENTVDAATEKHVPVITKTEKGFLIKVGEVPHPMEDKHYIQWIEASANGRIYKKFLKPNDKPEMEVCTKDEKITAREYCNLHGTWKKD
ncbi:MAG: desulfoferrodoxin [Elusimicrobiaceae bacterium]|jgi:superoxide reductase|nr:desulfoferrodoxin [Elusimicrobiaceae bacterium]MBT3955213.1 desulfoferrodoxin [Elusimicrobiaceae bacterium]MBT4007782.1 desulfoferrodoxin [Elusimicrobiaceae bacterium]MBT4403311.1 desulfoferrodoxin [Elusimicrobiaceae bacterium]MBT4440383.1 desulfoferrodoxin [Elusimicrobiaceae bacterium]